jgi:hypothetical protein
MRRIIIITRIAFLNCSGLLLLLLVDPYIQRSVLLLILVGPYIGGPIYSVKQIYSIVPKEPLQRPTSDQCLQVTITSCLYRYIGNSMVSSAIWI